MPDAALHLDFVDGAITASWTPEGGWVAVLVAAVVCGGVVGAIVVALAGRPGARLATGVTLGYLVVCGVAAAARINLAVDHEA
jgi:hypothetical protein